MINKIVMGEFPSEPFWDNDSFVKLPHISVPCSMVYNNAMDELLAAFTDKNTILFTKMEFNHSLHKYFYSIGANFISENSYPKESHNIFDEYALMRASKHVKAANLVPFAIIDGTHKLEELLSGSKTTLPSLQCVRKVNSKLFSTELGCCIGINNYGKVLRDLSEVERFLSKGLSEGNSGMLLKEYFGVSGKGSFIITNDSSLNNILSYLKRQTQTGKEVALIGEPFFLNKMCDFSATFELSKLGEIKEMYLSEQINNLRSYVGTKDISEKYVDIIKKSKYFDIIQNISDVLHKEGYWGPVCVDSMILSPELVIPVVEINARLSLSRIKYCWDRRLNLTMSELHCTRVKLTQINSYSDFLRQLKQCNLLYPQCNGGGIIPLSANMLLPRKNGFCSGKFYYIITASCNDEMSMFSDRLKSFIKEKS